uniref:Uncharacterized protein n=1 Tax=Salvator merianae TaxID=96440 RepID=A0A8D0BX56_SALMN
MASKDSDDEFSSQTTCLTCQQHFNDPVALNCGHTVCSSCLTKRLGESTSEITCPQCSESFQHTSCQTREQPAPPTALVEPVQEGEGAETKNGECEKDGECEENGERKKDGECEENGECEKKSRKLYCKDDQLPFCLPCDTSKDQKGHKVEDVTQKAQVTQSALSENKTSEIPVSDFPGIEEEKEALCPICWEYLTDPVTLDCGHNFCQSCITEHYEKGAQTGKLTCPLCKVRIRERNFRPNPQLAKIVEDLKFRPLKSHKEKIQAQLKSREEKRKRLVDQKLVEEARSQECMKQLYLEIQKSQSAFEQMYKFLEEREFSWLSEMRALRKEVEKQVEKNENVLSVNISHLTNLIAEMKEKCEEPPHTFMRDIADTISRFEKDQVGECEDLSIWLEESLEMCRQKNSALIMSMAKCAESMEETLKNASLDKELKKGFLKQKKNKVNVTLDAEAAHPDLILSADLKSVKTGHEQQNLPENPKRFEAMRCVLGCEKFTSGIHWWEVELNVDVDVEEDEWFDRDDEQLLLLGIARESIQRKRDFNPSPKAGVWAVGIIPLFKELLVFTPRKLTRVKLKQELTKIQVILDYDAGQVEFLDSSSNTSVFIYPSASFAGEPVYPFFCLEGKGLQLKCLD